MESIPVLKRGCFRNCADDHEYIGAADSAAAAARAGITEMIAAAGSAAAATADARDDDGFAQRAAAFVAATASDTVDVDGDARRNNANFFADNNRTFADNRTTEPVLVPKSNLFFELTPI